MRRISDIASRAVFLDGLQLSRAAFEIARYRDLRFRSGKAILGSWARRRESHRYISPRLLIARLNHAPFPNTLAQVYMNMKYKRKEKQRDTLIRSRWSRSRSCISPVLLFLLLLLLLLLRLLFAKSRFRKSDSMHFHVLIYTCMCTYTWKDTHVRRRDLRFYKRILV